MKRKPVYYSFGLKTVLAGEKVTKFENATECAKRAAAEGFSFIMGYHQNGDQVVLALNHSVQVISKDEAREKYVSDGDKRAQLNRESAKIWIVAPIADFSDVLIPFSGRIKAFKLIKPEDGIL